MALKFITSMHTTGSAPSIKERENAFLEELQNYQYDNPNSQLHYTIEKLVFNGSGMAFALVRASEKGIKVTSRILQIQFRAAKIQGDGEYVLRMTVNCASKISTPHKILCPIELLEAISSSSNSFVSGLWLELSYKAHRVRDTAKSVKAGQLYRRKAGMEDYLTELGRVEYVVCRPKGLGTLICENGCIYADYSKVVADMELVDMDSLSVLPPTHSYKVEGRFVFDGATLLGLQPNEKQVQSFYAARKVVKTASAPVTTAYSFNSHSWFA